MNWMRRALLELWAMSMIASVVGFLGPLGTYSDGAVADRIVQWWQLLMGAYLFVRPLVVALRWLATATSLPSRPLVLWGVFVASAPLAMLWRQVGQDAYRELDGYVGLIPFALLCALTVLGVELWANHANERLRSTGAGNVKTYLPRPTDTNSTMHAGASAAQPATSASQPKLIDRLSPTFQYPILALKSEDHYIRVHGMAGSELILLRLRDAIAEMAGVPGEQVHRSWWVARDGVVSFEHAGRTWVIRLRNGETVPVARESTARLQRSGFLPASASP